MKSTDVITTTNTQTKQTNKTNNKQTTKTNTHPVPLLFNDEERPKNEEIKKNSNRIILFLCAGFNTYFGHFLVVGMKLPKSPVIFIPFSIKKNCKSCLISFEVACKFVKKQCKIYICYRSKHMWQLTLVPKTKWPKYIPYARHYKPRIFSLKNQEFPFLVHKLSAI